MVPISAGRTNMKPTKTQWVVIGAPPDRAGDRQPRILSFYDWERQGLNHLIIASGDARVGATAAGA